MNIQLQRSNYYYYWSNRSARPATNAGDRIDNYCGRFWIGALQPSADAQSLSFALRRRCHCSALICEQLNPHTFAKISLRTGDVLRNDVGEMAWPDRLHRVARCLYLTTILCYAFVLFFFSSYSFHFFSHGLVSFFIHALRYSLRNRIEW